MKAHKLVTVPVGTVTSVLTAVAMFLDGILNLLPATWAAKIRSVRKAVAAGATSALSILTGLAVIPLPASVQVWVTVAIAIAGTLVTFGVPNDA